MDYKYGPNDGSLIVYMPNEIDHHHAAVLIKEMDQLLTEYRARILIFDFQNTVFMDSSGIGVILGRYKNMHYTSGKVIAIHLNDQINKIFRLSGLHKIVEVQK